MAPPQRVLGLNHRNRYKIFKSLLLQNHLPQMFEIWFVALPGGLFICNVGQDHSLTLNQCLS